MMMQIPSLIVLLLLILLQGSTAQGNWQSSSTVNQTYSTVRIELDPDVASIKANCTSTFFTNLGAQLMPWFTGAVASYTRSYTPVARPYAKFSNTMRWGQNVAGRRRTTDEEKDNNVLVVPPVVSEEPTTTTNNNTRDRNLCSITSCYNCCLSYCNVWCNGKCSLCRQRRRNLVRRNSADDRSRDLLEQDKWWWGDQGMQSVVSQSVETMVQQWLYQNDATQCMGNAWKLQVHGELFIIMTTTTTRERR